MTKTVAALLATFALSVGGVSSGSIAAVDASQIESPAAAGSGMYSLAASSDGTVYLSWLEPAAGRSQALKFSTLDRDGWTAARTIAAGDHWFVNWADHPSIVPLADGSLVAHWLVDNDVRTGSYGYGLRIARSSDRGATWHEVFKAGTANVEGYSGFVSMLPLGGGFVAAYLTPMSPESHGSASTAGHVMGLRAATFAREGAQASDVVLDADTCTCCPTAVAQTSRGPIVAYRDHTGATRDISIVRFRDGRWTPPAPVHRDGWRIDGCPTNGPALATSAAHVAVAWFTAAGDVPHVKLAFSNDAGDHFASPVVVDGGRPVGWPGVVLADDGSAVVSWVETLGDGRGEVRIRRVWPDGGMGVPVVVATSGSNRSTGVPQLVRSGDSLVVAWRADRVLTARVPIPSSKEDGPSAHDGRNANLPRTPDGHPDLHGVWDNAPVTPLERPKEMEGKAFFTKEELDDYVKHGLDRFRAARGEVEFQTNGEINGIWSAPVRIDQDRRTSIVVDPPDGRLPALTPDAQARVLARAAVKKDHPFDNPEDLTLGERCLMWGAGPPMLPTPQNSILQIVQTRDNVMVLNELMHDVRIVPMDGRPHLPPAIRQFKGDPRGQWDGDTLVVDTTNFSDKTELRGTTSARHVIERLTLVDADTIRYQFTVDDPTSLTRPWSGELSLKRTADQIFEYACHEANYSMELILRGARAEEQRSAKP